MRRVVARYVPLTRFLRSTPSIIPRLTRSGALGIRADIFRNPSCSYSDVGSTLRAHRQTLADKAGVVGRRCGSASEWPIIRPESSPSLPTAGLPTQSRRANYTVTPAMDGRAVAIAV